MDERATYSYIAIHIGKRGLVTMDEALSIRVRVQTYDLGVPFVVTVPINALVNNFVTELIADLDPPQVASNGHPLAYSFVV